MKQYAVKITKDARTDLESIYFYIADELQSPEIAAGQYTRITDAILALDTMPERFEAISFENRYDVTLRRMPVDHYSVFYFVEKDSVIVTNVLYSAVNIMERLK